MHIVTTTNGLIIFLVISIFVFLACSEKTKALLLNILIIVGCVISLIHLDNRLLPAPTTQPTTQQVLP